MSLRFPCCAAAIAAAACAPLPAAAEKPPVARAPASVDAVVVTAARTPKVVGSYPAQGAAVPFGHLILKLVFDQNMSPDAFVYAAVSAGAPPPCLTRPRLLADQRTFVLLCSVGAQGRFALRTAADRPASGFSGRSGRPAEPFTLRFTTTSEYDGSLHAALADAGLTDADDPMVEGARPSAPRPDGDDPDAAP